MSDDLLDDLRPTVAQEWSYSDTEAEFGRRVISLLREGARLDPAMLARMADVGTPARLEAAQLVVTFGRILEQAIELGLAREVDPFKTP